MKIISSFLKKSVFGKNISVLTYLAKIEMCQYTGDDYFAGNYNTMPVCRDRWALERRGYKL